MRECLEEIRLPKAVLAGEMIRQADAKATLGGLITAHRRESPAGSVLILEGEETSSIFLVLSGWLLATKSLADGQRQIIDIILPGGILEPACADRGRSAVEIQTLTDVTLAAIPRKRWRGACDRHPDIDEMTHRVIGAAMSRMSARMIRLGKAPAETVIAFALCELCLRSTARALADGTQFHIPMTQQQLGDFCGLSAVHVCRTLRRLARNDVLSVKDHMNIVIHDMDAMARIAEIDVEALRAEII